VQQAHLFAAMMGAGSYTYTEATFHQYKKRPRLWRTPSFGKGLGE
jgi:hypothetical protein